MTQDKSEEIYEVMEILNSKVTMDMKEIKIDFLIFLLAHSKIDWYDWYPSDFLSKFPMFRDDQKREED